MPGLAGDAGRHGGRGARSSGSPRLAVDRVACTGHGVCAQLLPEQVTLDEWGYPILTDRAGAAEDVDLTVRSCPARALYLRQAPPR